MVSTKFSTAINLARSLRRILGGVLSILILALSPVTALAKDHPKPAAVVGDPLPRIQCPVGYTATIYAEGLSGPDGLAFDPAGILHVAEETTGRVSRIEADGSVTPILTGLAKPEGIVFDNAGNLYVVEDIPEPPTYLSEGRLIKMNPMGVTTTLAGNLDAPEGVVWASDGTIYFTESNVQFTSSGFDYRTYVTQLSPPGGPSHLLTNDWFWSYAGITLGPDGLLYVTNEASGTGTTDSIFKVDPTSGTRTLFASNLVSPEGLRFTANGQFPLYVAEEDTGSGGGRVNQIDSSGNSAVFCTGFYAIEDVIIDAAGRLYVSEDTTGLIILIAPEVPQNIILLIGDGMGQAHRTAAQWSVVGQSGTLAMDDMPVSGWSRTSSADNPITDSAAAGTALATGVKTNNDVIGQDPFGHNILNILERAQAKGMAVGLVSNTQMAHATPASFAAHVPSRIMMTEIASQMLAAQVDVLLGGGEDEFLPPGVIGCYPQAGERDDGRNLIDEATAAGYTYVCNQADFSSVDPATTARLLGLFADEGLTRPYSPSLATMTQKAIDILAQDPDGFFLMVEGGKIDSASHENDATNAITDTVGLDEAVAVAQTYASTVSNTLIIVTADHETGGMSADLTSSGASNENGPFQMPDTTPFYINWQGLLHTAANVPTTAQGPWADSLAGTYANTHIHDVMCQALGPSKDQVVGHLFRDINGDGLQNTGEPNLAEVSIIITDTLGITQTATTNSNGHYTAVVPLGTTILDIDDTSLPIYHTLTTANDPQTVVVTACQTTISNKVGYEIQPATKNYLPLILKNR